MGFYSKLSVETHNFTEFLNRANAGDLGIALMYGFEKSKFIMHATESLKNNKNITKVLEGCIQNELWGFLTFLLTQYSSYAGVKKIILKNYTQIPKEFRASIVSVLCYGQKWTDDTLNDIFIDLVVDQDEKENNLAEIDGENEEIEVYYPLGWNESISSAVNNPCWFYSELDAEAYCLYTKLFYVKNSNIPELKEYLSDYYMFGEGELHSIETIKTRIVKGKIHKKDILAVIEPEELYDEFLPQMNFIQNQSVYDLKEIPICEVEGGETDSLATLLSIFNDELDSDELIDKTWDLYDLIIKNCEKYGMPNFVEMNEVQNKEMISPNEVALLIRTRLRVTKGNAIKVAKTICKIEKNARWVLSNSKGYKSKRGYFYRGLCFSSYSNRVFAVAFQYMNDTDVRVITDEETMEESEGFTDVFAVDFQTESKSLEGCLEKCRMIANSGTRKEKTIEVKHVKEELTSEEREAIKKQYRKEVDDEYQKEIQLHKNNVESKESEIDNLRIRCEQLLKENEKLKYQLEKKQAILDKQSDISILSLGNEKEKYDGESHAIVMSALRHELKSCERDTRRYDVIENIIEKNNEETDPIYEKLKEIKQFTRGYRVASEITKKLEEQGFEVIQEGKHPKIRYPHDDRYQITAASTSSDKRAGENLYALIKKKFF